MGQRIEAKDVAIGQTVKDVEDGARYLRTDGSWRGVTIRGELTGSVLLDRTMARKSLELVATVEPAPAGKRAAELADSVAEIVANVLDFPARDSDLGLCNVLVDNERGRIVSGVPYDVYSALPGENYSALKMLKRSPLHYRHALENKTTSDALSLGTAAHCAVLEPERFADEFVAWESTTKTGRMSPRTGEKWDAFVAAAEANGQTVITADEMEKARTIAAAVRGNPDAMKYLQTGHPEVSMEWTRGGHKCRGRVDWLTTLDGADVVVGLKTSRDCRPREFGRQSYDLAYHWQWAYYHDGFEAITCRRPFMVEIVVESAAPHAVAVYIIGEAVMTQGRDEYEAALEELAECRASGVWPGPVQGEQELVLPPWAYGEGYGVEIKDADDAGDAA